MNFNGIMPYISIIKTYLPIHYFLKGLFEAETPFQNSYNLITQDGQLSHALLQVIINVNTRWHNCTIRNKTTPIDLTKHQVANHCQCSS